MASSSSAAGSLPCSGSRPSPRRARIALGVVSANGPLRTWRQIGRQCDRPKHGPQRGTAPGRSRPVPHVSHSKHRRVPVWRSRRLLIAGESDAQVSLPSLGGRRYKVRRPPTRKLAHAHRGIGKPLHREVGIMGFVRPSWIGLSLVMPLRLSAQATPFLFSVAPPPDNPSQRRMATTNWDTENARSNQSPAIDSSRRWECVRRSGHRSYCSREPVCPRSAATRASRRVVRSCSACRLGRPSNRRRRRLRARV